MRGEESGSRTENKGASQARLTPGQNQAVLLVPTLADEWMIPFLDSQADLIPDLGELR